MKTTFIDQLKLVANGINPLTGEELPPRSIAHKPECIRLLYRLVEALEKDAGTPKKQKKPAGVDLREKNRKEGRPLRSGVRWEDDEIKRLKDGYQSGKAISEIAGEFERTELAIAIQLHELGLLEVAQVEQIREQRRVQHQEGLDNLY